MDVIFVGGPYAGRRDSMRLSSPLGLAPGGREVEALGVPDSERCQAVWPDGRCVLRPMS